jgi:hypothetical protein
MKQNGHGPRKAIKAPAFVARAERAFRRVARQLRAENARLDLPLVLGEKNHVRLVRAR